MSMDIEARDTANAAKLLATNAMKAAAPKRAPLRMVTFGDSNGQYPLSWAKNIARLSGGKIRLVNNACIAGETSAQIAARWSRDGEPFQPDIAAFEMGTNDAANAAAIVPHYLALIKASRACASDPYVFVLATVPHASYIAAGAATLAALQAMVAANFASDPKVIFIDTYTPLLDPTNPAVIPNLYFQDVHFTRRGAHKCAEVVLSNAAVVAAMSNIVVPTQTSASDPARQIVPNPNFDTGAETSGRANNWTSYATGTAPTFSTGTDSAITGKYQRVSVPPGCTYLEFKNTVSSMVAAIVGGRRVSSGYKVRVVSRPSDVTPSVVFAGAPGLNRDAASYWYGDAQNGYQTSAAPIAIADMEDGTWYFIYNETVADEDPFAALSLFTVNGNTGNAALVIDVAEINPGLIDPASAQGQGVLVSYKDSSATPGAATINKSAGRSALAAGASSVVITNSLVKSTSVVLLQLEDNDATATRITVTCANGSFTVAANAAATAATKFRWLVAN